MKNALPIYLDYAATTPLDPQVRDAMWQYLTQEGMFGNPASLHIYGEQAQQAIDHAQQAVARLINASPREIIWTSGATESNNLAIKGAAYFYQKKGRHIITVATEHKAVLDTCKALEQEGFTVTYLPVLSSGLIDLEVLKTAINTDTLLISVMHVNNETGIIQDLAAISQIAQANNLLFHVDAAQSVGKIPLDVQALNIDLLSLSAHKLYGPKGIGALYVRHKPKVRLMPLIHGGGHQQGLRSGTLPTAQIVGLGTACNIAQQTLSAEKTRITELRQQLWQGIATLPGVQLNGDLERQAPGILNVSFNLNDGEALLMNLPGLAVSAGSACDSTNIEPSFVLKAMGCSDQSAHSAIRFSIGRFTTALDIEQAITQIQQAVYRLLTVSPLYTASVPAVELTLQPKVSLSTHYNATIWKYFLHLNHVGSLDIQQADVIQVQQGIPLQGNVVQLSLKIKDAQIVDALFKAHGCGVMLATACFAVSQLIGKPITAAKKLNSAYMAEQLQLPDTKFHCAMRMEDTITAALKLV